MKYIFELETYSQKIKTMQFEPLVITANMVSGTHITNYMPIYLDNLIARMVVEEAIKTPFPDQSIDGYWLPVPMDVAGYYQQYPLWNASVFFVVDESASDIVYLHKRSLSGQLSKPRNISTAVGRWMERRIPIPTMICNELQARCIGNQEEIQRLLENVHFIGKHHNRGFGEVKNWTIEKGTFETALVSDSQLTHAIPVESCMDVCNSIITRQSELVGWTPPEWKMALFSLGWPVGTRINEQKVDYWEEAEKLSGLEN